ncbi:MAG: hypothetical protein WBN11_11155, partial [Eudoraea sp.]|uniref:hypothetical protein n=1 Tax=Eudoraea sp. TaxID=1979955 RepID=UPI003C72F393
MKHLIIKLYLLTTFYCFSQNEQERFRIVASEFQSSYNESNDKDIYGMFDAVMKTYLSLEQTSNLLNTIRSNFGLIENMQFLGINNS